jgi:hypothetical protein
MPFSARGRPANEIQSQNGPIFPFSYFGRVGQLDDSATIQAAEGNSKYG